MNKLITYICIIGIGGIALTMPAAYAVCLDPKTLVSGYHVPLDEEIRTSKLIAVGEVTKSRYLKEDPTDPDDITAYIYTIRVLRPLKGRVPKLIELRSENDSGRYLMKEGERHLLFISSEGQHFVVDSCGNSSSLPKGNAVLQQVEATLARSASAP
jgi:hypothetical protein